MAEETKSEATSGWTLKGTFNKLVHHLFSPTMIFMMAAMAFPMIGAAATAAGAKATIGDLALGTIDMYWEMAKAPFTDGGVVVDAFNSATNGNIMPGSYEMGMMDHSNMMSGGEHAGHMMNETPQIESYDEWLQKQSAADQEKLQMMQDR